jgi:hypothetical protein
MLRLGSVLAPSEQRAQDAPEGCGSLVVGAADGRVDLLWGRDRLVEKGLSHLSNPQVLCVRW